MAQVDIKEAYYKYIKSLGYKWYDKSVRKRSYKNVQFSFYKL